MNELEKKYEEIMWMISSFVRNDYISEEVEDEIKAEITEFYKMATEK